MTDTRGISTDATGADIAIGDRVAYSARWLRSAQAHHLGNARGTVIEAGGVLVRVDWDGGHAAGTPVLARNVVREDRMWLEPA